MTPGRLAMLVEDDEQDLKRIEGSLLASGFTVLSASDSGEALTYLAGTPFPDLVVLDWFCEGSEAGDWPAQNVVRNILHSAFAPIAVITNDVVRARQNIPAEMPLSFCEFFDKFELDTVLAKLDEWTSRKEFVLARKIAKAGTSGLARVAWELARYQEAGVNSWLGFVDDGLDFLEMFLRFVKRELGEYPELMESLDAEISKMKEATKVITPLLFRAVSSDRYFVPPPFAHPMSGDIYKTAEGSYVILANPACDLVSSPNRPRKATQATLLAAPRVLDFEPEASKSGASRKNRILGRLMNQDPAGTGQVRTYGLPLVPIGKPDPYSAFVDLVIDFDNPSVLTWPEFQSRFPSSSRIARLDSPYLEALLRQYSLFADRIGLRDLPEKVLEERVKQALGSEGTPPH